MLMKHEQQIKVLFQIIHGMKGTGSRQRNGDISKRYANDWARLYPR